MLAFCAGSTANAEADEVNSTASNHCILLPLGGAPAGSMQPRAQGRQPSIAAAGAGLAEAD
jgi:hypothetical protein